MQVTSSTCTRDNGVSPSRVVAGAQLSRGLDHQVDTEIPPTKVGRVLLAEGRDALTSDVEVGVVVVDIPAQSAKRGVVLQEVRQRARIPEIVDAGNPDTAFEQSPLQQKSPL